MNTSSHESVVIDFARDVRFGNVREAIAVAAHGVAAGCVADHGFGRQGSGDVDHHVAVAEVGRIAVRDDPAVEEQFVAVDTLSESRHGQTLRAGVVETVLVGGHSRTLAQPTAARFSNPLFAPLFGPLPVGGKSKD
jgi:hypothetical protein